MGKEIMKQDLLKERIPVLNWKKNPLISIGEGKFVNLQPIGRGVRTLEIAKRMANRFGEMYKCQATITDDAEWKKVIDALDEEKNEFIEMHNLRFDEVLLLDSNQKVDTHVLAGGFFHEVDEIFNGFISAFDAKGVEQPTKLVFVTLDFTDSEIEYVS